MLGPLGPDETRRRLLEALARWHEESFATREAGLVELLAADALATRELAATMAPARLVELVWGGFAYEPEPECPRVLLDVRLAAASRFRLGFPRSFLESGHVRGLIFGRTYQRIAAG